MKVSLFLVVMFSIKVIRLVGIGTVILKVQMQFTD